MAMNIGKTDFTAGLQNKYMNNAQSAASKALNQIAATRALSGVDSANLAIADALRSDASGMRQGIANANDAVGIMQIADGTLESLNDATNRMSELSVRAISGVSLDENGRIAASEAGKDYQKALSAEASALKNSMQSSIDNAIFNGQNVFGGVMSFETGAGAFSVNMSAPNLAQLDISNPQSISDFRDSINRMRSDIGAAQNGIMSNINNLASSIINTTASESALQNNDVVKNLGDFNSANIKLNASTIASAHNVAALKNQVSSLLA